jgi:hypothetical protein
MPHSESADNNATVHRLKQQINELTEEQSEALESAIYVGMTPEEAKKYDARRAKIMQLAAHLQQLSGAQ